MRVGITGATGFIGKELGLALVQRGHQVVAFSRSPGAVELPFPHESRVWSRRTDEMVAALRGVDAIVHLAGESVAGGRWTAERKQQIQESRIRGTEILMEAVKRAPHVRAVIMASAVGYYGTRGNEELTEEASAAGEGFLAEVVREWENAFFRPEVGARRVALRIGVVLGRGGGALSKLLPIFQNGGGSALGNGHQWVPWVHLKDVVRAFVWALESETAQGFYNLASPKVVQNGEFSEKIAETLNSLYVVPSPPEKILRLMMGEMSDIVLSSLRVGPKRLLDEGFTFSFMSLTEALNDLLSSEIEGLQELRQKQWVPRPIDEVWSFFSTEKNLERITPPWLNFHVDRMSTPKIETSTEIVYSLKIRGVPARWVTRIDEWAPPHRFVDIQLKGPYDHWWHLHTFEPLAGGTLMTDLVKFRVPLGFLGRLFAGPFVRRDVEEVFSYRTKVIRDLFGSAGV